jgi:hypothetical protein
VATLSRLTLAPVVVSFALASLTTSCGGEERLSQEEFVSKGNAICAKYDKRVDAVGEPENIQEVPEYVDKLLPIVEEQIEEMRALKPPEDKQETFDRMIAKAEETRDAGEELAQAAEDRDDAAVQRAFAKGQEAGEETDRLAGELGLDECQD